MGDERTDTLSRDTGIAGLVFVALMLGGFLVARGTPAYDAPNREWIEWFDDPWDRACLVIGVLAGVLASLALVWFSVLVSTLIRNRGSSGSSRETASLLALASGTASAVFIAIGSLIGGSMALALTFAWNFDEVPSAELLKAVERMGAAIWSIGGGWAAALFVATVSRSARATGLLAGWLVTAGFVIAALLLLSFLLIPFALFPLWMLVVSIVLFRARTANEM
jgi:hypothetical protein